MMDELIEIRKVLGSALIPEKNERELLKNFQSACPPEARNVAAFRVISNSLHITEEVVRERIYAMTVESDLCRDDKRLVTSYDTFMNYQMTDPVLLARLQKLHSSQEKQQDKSITGYNQKPNLKLKISNGVLPKKKRRNTSANGQEKANILQTVFNKRTSITTTGSPQGRRLSQMNLKSCSVKLFRLSKKKLSSYLFGGTEIPRKSTSFSDTATGDAPKVVYQRPGPLSKKKAMPLSKKLESERKASEQVTTQPLQPVTAQAVAPKSSQPVTHKTSQPVTPKSSKPTTPQPSQPVTPKSSKPTTTPQSSQPVTPKLPKSRSNSMKRCSSESLAKLEQVLNDVIQNAEADPEMDLHTTICEKHMETEVNLPPEQMNLKPIEISIEEASIESFKDNLTSDLIVESSSSCLSSPALPKMKEFSIFDYTHTPKKPHKRPLSYDENYRRRLSSITSDDEKLTTAVVSSLLSPSYSNSRDATDVSNKAKMLDSDTKKSKKYTKVKSKEKVTTKLMEKVNARLMNTPNHKQKAFIPEILRVTSKPPSRKNSSEASEKSVSTVPEVISAVLPDTGTEPEVPVPPVVDIGPLQVNIETEVANDNVLTIHANTEHHQPVSTPFIKVTILPNTILPPQEFNIEESIVSNSIPIANNSIPIANNSIPISNNSIPIVSNSIPIANNSLPISIVEKSKGKTKTNVKSKGASRILEKVGDETVSSTSNGQERKKKSWRKGNDSSINTRAKIVDSKQNGKFMLQNDDSSSMPLKNFRIPFSYHTAAALARKVSAEAESHLVTEFTRRDSYHCNWKTPERKKSTDDKFGNHSISSVLEGKRDQTNLRPDKWYGSVSQDPTPAPTWRKMSKHDFQMNHVSTTNAAGTEYAHPTPGSSYYRPKSPDHRFSSAAPNFFTFPEPVIQDKFSSEFTTFNLISDAINQEASSPTGALYPLMSGVEFTLGNGSVMSMSQAGTRNPEVYINNSSSESDTNYSTTSMFVDDAIGFYEVFAS